MKGLVKSGTANTKVVHMASFNDKNASSATSLYENAFFFSSDVRGEAIFL